MFYLIINTLQFGKIPGVESLLNNDQQYFYKLLQDMTAYK